MGQRLSPISFQYAISLNANWAGPRASAHFENLNGHLWPALDPKLSSLARWTHSIRIQQNGAWNEIGGGVMEKLVSVPQTR